MPKEKIENWKKELDEQWKETDHYIIWEFWIKDFIRQLLKSKQEKLLERIEKLRKYEIGDIVIKSENWEKLKEEIKKDL